MKFSSTTGKGEEVSFKEAVLGNLTDDGGLYFPSEIPQLTESFLKEIPEMDLPAIGFEVLNQFCRDDIEQEALSQIAKRVFDFPIPLVEVEETIHCLELFHGPTFAFKDVGAKFLAECLAYFGSGEKHETTVLVATSGDTGGAVANGFLGVKGVNVVIGGPYEFLYMVKLFLQI